LIQRERDNALLRPMTEITPEKKAIAKAARFSKGEGQGRMKAPGEAESTKQKGQYLREKDWPVRETRGGIKAVRMGTASAGQVMGVICV
jgi:hypothetical protein